MQRSTMLADWDIVTAQSDERERKKVTTYMTFHIDLRNGLHKEIRFTNGMEFNMLVRYIYNMKKEKILTLADNMIIQRKDLLDKISSGLGNVRGNLTVEASMCFIQEYLATETSAMEFEVQNFSDKNAWAKPQKWVPKDGDFTQLKKYYKAREELMSEWSTPGYDWLFSNSRNSYWPVTPAESFRRARQEVLYFEKPLPKPEGWNFELFRDSCLTLDNRKIEMEEHKTSSKELMCCFLGQVSTKTYREFRLRYSSEMMNFSVPNMKNLMVKVEHLIREREYDSKYGFMWSCVRSAIVPSTAKYLYALFQQGESALKRFEHENTYDALSNGWLNEGPITKFFKFFNRTIHYETAYEAVPVTKITFTCGQSGVEFINCIKNIKNGVPDYGDYTFGVDHPLTEEELFPKRARKDNGTQVPEMEEDAEIGKELEKEHVETTPEKESVSVTAEQAQKSAKDAHAARQNEEQANNPIDEDQELSKIPTHEIRTTLSYAKIAEKKVIGSSKMSSSTQPSIDSEENNMETDGVEREDVLPQEVNRFDDGTLEWKEVVTKTNDPRSSKQKTEQAPKQANTDKKNMESKSKQMKSKKQTKANNKNEQKSFSKFELLKDDAAEFLNSSENCDTAKPNSSNSNTKEVKKKEIQDVREQNKVQELLDDTIKKEQNAENNSTFERNIQKDAKNVEELDEKEGTDACERSSEQIGNVETNQIVSEELAKNDDVKNNVDDDSSTIQPIEKEEQLPVETKTAKRKAKKAAKLLRQKQEREARAAAKPKPAPMKEQLVAAADDGTFTEADFEITIRDSKRPSKSVPDNQKVVVETRFTDEAVSLFVNDVLLPAQDDLLEVPETSEYSNIKYEPLVEEADDSEEYVPGSTVAYDYRPCAQSNENKENPDERAASSSDGTIAEEEEEEDLDAENVEEKPTDVSESRDDSNGDRSTTTSSRDTSSVNLNPHKNNVSPTIQVLNPAIAEKQAERRASDPNLHDMFRRLKFLADKKARGGLQNVDKARRAIILKRLQKFNNIYYFRLRIARAMLYIIDIDPAADISGAREADTIRLLLLYIEGPVENESESMRGRNIDKHIKDSSFANYSDSDVLNRGLRYIDLRLAELNDTDPLFTAYVSICDKLVTLMKDQEILMKIIGTGVDFTGYDAYL